MRFRYGLALIVLFTAAAASAQSINFTSSRYETVAKNATIYNRETSRIERFLTSRFPSSNLRWEARAKQAPTLRKANYEVVYHLGVKYLVAVYTSRYDEPVNMMAVYQMSGEQAGERVWRSKAWTSNYYGNTLTPFKNGSRTLMLFKEGGIMPGDFGLASVFSIARYGGRTYVKDNTPASSPLTVKPSFPFRAILGQNVQMTPSSNAGLTLAASESMYRYEGQIYQQTHEWQYDRKKNSFEPVMLNAEKLTRSN
jgi:hypothetical protein